MPGYFDPQYGPQGFAPTPATKPIDLYDVFGVPQDRRVDSNGIPLVRRGDIALDNPSVGTSPAPVAAPRPVTPSITLPPLPASDYQLPGTMIGRSGQAPAASAPEPYPGLKYSVDRSRGTSGAEWAAQHAPVAAPAASFGGGPGYLFSGNGTQADLEGRANARRMLEAAYGPTTDFDPTAARIKDATSRGDLLLAEERAKDPMAFARAQAGLGEEAKQNARLKSGANLAGVLQSFDDKLGAVEARRAAFRQRPEYQSATPEARQKAEDAEGFDLEAARIRSQMRLIEQSMGFATGQTPSSLYATNPFGG